VAPICLLWSVLLPARARADIQVNPSIVRPVVTPGATVDFTLSVINRDPTSRRFEVKVTNMTAAPEGFPTSAPADALRGCGAWIALSPTDFALTPKATQTVRCRLRAPRAVSGGYYALIIVESPAPRAFPTIGNRSAAIQMSQAFGTAVLATVRGPGISVKLRPAGVRFTRAPRTGGSAEGWIAQALVRNDGTIHAKAQGTLEVRSAGGAVVGRAVLEGGAGTVLPGAVRRFSARHPGPLADGVYVVTARFFVTGTRPATVESQAFVVSAGRVEPVSANESLSALMRSLTPAIQLAPEQIDLSVAPGSRRFAALRLQSAAKEPLDLGARCSEWQLSPTGEDEFPLQKPKHGRSAVPWLSLSQPEVLLSPGARATIRVIAAVPKGTPPGDYFASVRVRGDSAPTGMFYPSFATVRISVGKNAPASCQIKSCEVISPNTPQAVANVAVLNTGSVAIWPAVTLAVTDSAGKSALPPTPLGDGDQVILPGQIRRFSCPLDLILRPGQHTATVTAVPRDKAEPASQTVKFSAPSWTSAPGSRSLLPRIPVKAGVTR